MIIRVKKLVPILKKLLIRALKILLSLVLLKNRTGTSELRLLLVLRTLNIGLLLS